MKAFSVLLFFFYLFIYLFIYFFWLFWVFVAACGLSLVAVRRGSSLVAGHGLLTGMPSLVAEHRL